MTKFAQWSALVIGATGLALSLAACGGQPASMTPQTTAPGSSAPPASTGSALTGEVVSDGSSTVGPLTSAAATLFREQQPGVNVSVAISGTGGGFKRFCANEIDLSNASRAIKDEEAADCQTAGVKYSEIIIANDGLSVVVNKENTWAKCLTVKQLATIWGPDSEGKVTSWKQVDPSFPDEPLALYGAGTDSGTFDFFTGAINGEEGAIRTDYTPSEDDNLTIQGVTGARGGIGFFGLSYFEENQDKLNLVDIDGGSGCVTPSSVTVQDGTYTPLGRPLFVYVNQARFAANPALRAFLDFYVANEEQIAKEALFIGLTDAQQQTAKQELAGIPAA